MLILKSIPDFQSWRQSLLPSLSVGFVPTMGALHAGHLKLMGESRAQNDVTVVSIFVNPLQFGPSEDLSRYPRPFENDCQLCEAAGVSVIFAPEVASFYSNDHATYCDVQGLGDFLCGESRPGHFKGVCTVVLKLFHLVKPSKAYFGQKDIQQALILKKMVSDLSLDVEMVLVETVREDSGLALSSRNKFLTTEECQRATALYRGLCLALHAFQKGERKIQILKQMVLSEIEASKPTRIDYVEIVSQNLLQPVLVLDDSAVLAVAVFYGKTRLIDNVLLDKFK